MMKALKYKNIHYFLFAAAASVSLVACQEKDFQPREGDAVCFVAQVNDEGAVKSRTPSEDASSYVTSSVFGNDIFYMQMEDLENAPSETNPLFGRYVVSSGFLGRLDPASDSEPLMWQTLRGEHMFYGWTFPSGGYLGEYPPNPYEADNLDQNNLPSAELHFFDSADAEDGSNEGNDKFHNNNIYENFIGVKKGPMKYIETGTYVPLIFKHLVSKIYIEDLILNDNGAIQEHLEADMTFYGMPNTATFYPRPKADSADEKEVRAYNLANGAPAVVPGEIDVYNNEMTYHISNTAEHDDYFYICPELDFSQLSFCIKLNNTESAYSDMKEFSGTFSNVYFERVGTNWDNTDDSGNPTFDDSTVLHAGEVMVLRIILYPYGGGGLFITVLPWSTHDPDYSTHHARRGIYTDNALNELASIADSDNANASMDNLFTLYGEDEDGEKVFNLYENGTLTSSNPNLRIRNGYVLDGNDHLITVSSSPLKVRNVRSVYLTDGKGNYVYIDADGNIYKVDGSTMEIGQQIGTMKKDVSTTIDIAKGTAT